MSEVVREFMTSPVGIALLAELRELQTHANGRVLDAARAATKPFDEVRYRVGVADGVGLAISLLNEVSK